MTKPKAPLPPAPAVVPTAAEYDMMTSQARFDLARRLLREALDNEAPTAHYFSMRLEQAIRLSSALMGERKEVVPKVVAEASAAVSPASYFPRRGDVDACGRCGALVACDAADRALHASWHDAHA